MKKISAQLYMYLIGVFLVRAIWFSSIPFITIYVTNNITNNNTIIGIIVGGGSIAACITGLLGGLYSDLFNPKKIMQILSFCSALAFFLCYILMPKTITLMFILNFIIWGASAAFGTANRTFISYSFAADEKILAYNLRYTVSNLGAILGPFFGAWAIKINLGVVFLAASLVHILVFVLFTWAFRKPIKIVNHDKNRFFQLIKNFTIGNNGQSILYLVFASFISYWFMSQFEIMIAQVLKLSHINNYIDLFAHMLSLNAITVVALMLPLGLIIHHTSLLKILKLAIFFYSISFISFSFANHNPLIWLLSAFIFTLGEIIDATVMNIFIEKLVSEEIKGSTFGIVSIGNLGAFLGPVIGGYILNNFGVKVFFYSELVLALLLLVTYKLIINKILLNSHQAVEL